MTTPLPETLWVCLRQHRLHNTLSSKWNRNILMLFYVFFATIFRIYNELSFPIYYMRINYEFNVHVF